MDMEKIMLKEIRQSEKDKYHIWFHLYVEPNEQTELTWKIETDLYISSKGGLGGGEIQQKGKRTRQQGGDCGGGWYKKDKWQWKKYFKKTEKEKSFVTFSYGTTTQLCLFCLVLLQKNYFKKNTRSCVYLKNSMWKSFYLWTNFQPWHCYLILVIPIKYLPVLASLSTIMLQSHNPLQNSVA